MAQATDVSRATVAPVALMLVSHSYIPVLGGSEIEAQRVSSALIRRGHRVTVLCAGGAPMPATAQWVDPAGVPVRILTRRSRGAVRDWIFAFGVAWTLVRERRHYQIVYFLMQGAHLAVGLPVARMLGKPVVMKISGSSIATIMRGSRLGRLELRWLNRWAHRVMILNPGIAEEAIAAGLRPERLVWMPNPVDIEEFVPCSGGARGEIRERLGIPGGAEVVIYVGRLAPEKELGSLLGAFAGIAPSRPEAQLILIGEGPCRRELEARAAQLGLGNRVRFEGRQPAAGICRWLQAADVFALLSSNEGFPCALSEAMAAGLASVVSDIPGNIQLIDPGIHGLVVPVNDETRIAEAIGGLLANAECRERMGQAARRRIVENYSTAKIAERYEELFQEAKRGLP